MEMLREGAAMGLVAGLMLVALQWGGFPATSQGNVGLMYHGDVIDTFDGMVECFEMLPTGGSWGCLVLD